MSTWQRRVRLAMLFIFVPTAVLAAKPLTYCVSAANAHSALEYVYLPGPGHHNVGDGEQAAARIAQNGTAATTPGDTCVDYSILTAVQPEERANQSKPPVPASLETAQFPSSEFGREASQARFINTISLYIARVLHPQIAELSGIKLRN